MLLPLATVTPLARHSPASSAAAAFCLPPLAPAAVRGRGAAATTGPWRLQRGRQLLRMFDQGGGGGGGEQPPPPQPVQRRRGPGIRGGSSGGGKAALKAEQELWEARRAISRWGRGWVAIDGWMDGLGVVGCHWGGGDRWMDG